MGALCDDFDLYPDEMLAKIAERLGCGPAFQHGGGRSVGSSVRSTPTTAI